MSSFSRAFRQLRKKCISSLFSGKFAFDPKLVTHSPKRQPLLERLESRQLLSAVYPEIDITGNSQSIANNDVTPSTADFTVFGSTDVNTGLITKTFKINNSGAGALNLTGSVKVKISGANSSDFSIVTQPSASIPGNNGTTSFSVKFDPSASGARAATLTIQNDDDDENPYVFSIQGTGTVTPKLSISATNTAIPANDIVPRLTDGA